MLARGAQKSYKGARNIIGKNKGATSSADDVAKVTKSKSQKCKCKTSKTQRQKNTKTNTTTRARDEKR